MRKHTTLTFSTRCRTITPSLATHGACRVAALAAVAVVAFALPGTVGTASAQTCDPAEIGKLVAADGAAYDAFGWSVSISGDTVLVGASENDDNGSYSGSAYVFTQSDGVWVQQERLLPSDGAAGDVFGYAVSLSGNTAVIGAWGDDDNASRSGSAYVFVQSGGAWTQQAKLLPTGGAKETHFGFSVGVDGDTAVIGVPGDDEYGRSSGSVYVFVGRGDVWILQAKLTASDAAERDSFGVSVYIDSDTVIVGSAGDDDNGRGSGSAYVFTRSDGVWMQQAKLLPHDGEQGDRFGIDVSVSGDTAVIAASGDDNNGGSSGSAYIFTRSGGEWIQQTKLLPDDGEERDGFAHSVSISSETVIVGASGDDDNGRGSGSAYVFMRSDELWEQRAKLLPHDGEEGASFGWFVSVSGDTAAIGAYRDNNRGAAYVFDLNCTGCRADFNSDGEVNTEDFADFLDAWTGGDPRADWNEDGVVDTRDVVAYLNGWVIGCP